jgi:RimJ/RimL family protein N-acetyltransferase
VQRSEEAGELGEPLAWRQVPEPQARTLRGEHALLRPLDAGRDAESLYAVSHAPEGDESIWRYLFDGPYEHAEALGETLRWMQASRDPLFFAISRRDDPRAVGLVSLMRITPEFGTIEIGNVWFGAPLQRSTAASEAIFLLLAYAFDELGYRRVEWRCNALNERSRRAAERFGLAFEGTFRKHYVVKGRNRDTAWYSIVDDEWPQVRAGFTAWLAPENFAPDGRQIRRLGELIAAAQER